MFQVKFSGSEEWIKAPREYAAKQAVSWAARLYDRTVVPVKELRPGVWQCSNGRRGVNKRSTVISVAELVSGS